MKPQQPLPSLYAAHATAAPPPTRATAFGRRVTRVPSLEESPRSSQLGRGPKRSRSAAKLRGEHYGCDVEVCAWGGNGVCARVSVWWLVGGWRGGGVVGQGEWPMQKKTQLTHLPHRNPV